MKIWVEIDKHNRLSGFSLDKNSEMIELDTTIEIDFKNFKNFILNGKELIYSELPEKPNDFISPEYNGEQWVETASLQSRIDFWKGKMIFISKEITTLKDIGLDGSVDYIKLQVQLEKYREYYMTASHELALEMDKSA